MMAGSPNDCGNDPSEPSQQCSRQQLASVGSVRHRWQPINMLHELASSSHELKRGHAAPSEEQVQRVQLGACSCTPCVSHGVEWISCSEEQRGITEIRLFPRGCGWGSARCGGVRRWRQQAAAAPLLACTGFRMGLWPWLEGEEALGASERDCAPLTRTGELQGQGHCSEPAERRGAGTASRQGAEGWGWHQAPVSA